jgi:hypothetical protein
MNGNMGDFRIGHIAAKAAELIGGGFTKRLQQHSPASPNGNWSSGPSDRFIGRALAQAPDASHKIVSALPQLAQYLGRATRPDPGFSTSA